MVGNQTKATDTNFLRRVKMTLTHSSPAKRVMAESDEFPEEHELAESDEQTSSSSVVVGSGRWSDSSRNSHADDLLLLGTGTIKAGPFSILSTGYYSSCPKRSLKGKNRKEVLERINQHQGIISMRLNRAMGTGIMVLFLENGLRRRLRDIHREKHDRVLGGLHDDYVICQCQQLVAEGFGLRATVQKGTLIEIFTDVPQGIVAVKVDGSEKKVMYDCPELAQACNNMFLDSRCVSPSLRKNVMKNLRDCGGSKRKLEVLDEDQSDT